MTHDISIVIRCSNDKRIYDCLKSIGTRVGEILVVLNYPTPEVENIVRNFGCRVVKVNSRNIALLQNRGVEAARFEKILLMDSDCIFGPGTIDKIATALDKHKVVRGQLVYIERDSVIPDVIQRFRNFIGARIDIAHTPLLGIRKSIKNDIGGYYYDESILWSEDFEMHLRLVEAGVEIYGIPNARAFNQRNSFWREMKGAMQYGIGGSLIDKKRKEPLLYIRKNSWIKFGNAWRQQGILTALYYQFFYYPFYLLGYLRERLNPITEKNRESVAASDNFFKRFFVS